ncbi:MAG: hypothetical protein WAU92_07140 [Candidatus Sulfotelmatobacter sp.]
MHGLRNPSRFASPTWGQRGAKRLWVRGKYAASFGLKLRAQDPCNLVYAMWRIDPESKLVVSVKTNQNAHTSAECGNHGYENIKPRKASRAPPARRGVSHFTR